MPDVHAGKDIVVGFTAPFKDCVNPDHIGGTMEIHRILGCFRPYFTDC
jgi:hypothetical protein